MAQPGMWRRTYPGPRLPPRSSGPALPRRRCPRPRRTRRCQGQRRLGQPRLPVLAIHPTSALRCPPGHPRALPPATVLPGPRHPATAPRMRAACLCGRHQVVIRGFRRLRTMRLGANWLVVRGGIRTPGRQACRPVKDPLLRPVPRLPAKTVGGISGDAPAWRDLAIAGAAETRARQPRRTRNHSWR